jgi:hypothetical protein
MRKTRTCLDCLHCKLINRHKELSCKAGMWQNGNGEPKYIKLQAYEIRTLDIKPRDLLKNAVKCIEMIDMD